MDQQFLNELLFEEQQLFSGGDFSYLEENQRMVEFPLKWNLAHVVKPYLSQCECLLDMNVLDGTYLSSLAPLPTMTVALVKEEKHVLEARKQLTPLGGSVVAFEEASPLPFEASSFELVFNRNERFDVDEISRILKENGYFITQQIGGLNNCELNLWLNVEPKYYSNWRLQLAVEQLKAAGLTIVEAKEDISKTRFYDVGAIVYYLKMMSEQIPDFSVEKYFNRLTMMKKVIEKEGHIDLTRHRFLIVAKKTDACAE